MMNKVDIMIVDLPRRDADGALRVAVELGHAIGSLALPAVVKGEQVLAPAAARAALASVPGLSHRVVPGAEVEPYLAPGEAATLFSAGGRAPSP
jgi:urease accessory protein